MRFRHRTTIFGITVHGIQSILLTTESLHLIDKNVASKLRGPSTKLSESDRYWLSVLNSEGRRVNPILCALEGMKTRVPTTAEFRLELDRVAHELRQSLPNVEVINHPEHLTDSLYALVDNFASRYALEQKFLLETVHLIAEKASDAECRRRNESVVALAKDLGIATKSLVPIAVLSCLNDDKHGNAVSPGRGVIKPKQSYGDKNAHNAISDLRALEILIASNAHGFGSPVLCTGDKPLARFWEALNFHGSRANDGSVKFNFDLTPKLMPRLSEPERERLAKQLVSD